MNGPLALTAMSQLGGLRRLNIQSFGDLSDAHLFLVATTLPELEQLKASPCPPALPLTWFAACQRTGGLAASTQRLPASS